jgi:very-short-patch-repair endonuclease
MNSIVEDFRVSTLKNFALNNYKQKLDEILSFAESPIEKIFLLMLFNYFNNYIQKFEGGVFQGKRTADFSEKVFEEVNFITEYLDTLDPTLSPSEKIEITDRIKKYKYRYRNYAYEKIIGFEGIYANEGITVVKLFSPEFDGLIERKIKVLPQKEVILKGHKHRIDIAIELERLKNNKIIEIRKVAIECDGHNYHSTPEQKDRDDERTINLSAKGWKVLRYSGRKINNLQDLDQFHNIFKNIIETLTN